MPPYTKDTNDAIRKAGKLGVRTSKTQVIPNESKTFREGALATGRKTKDFGHNHKNKGSHIHNSHVPNVSQIQKYII